MRGIDGFVEVDPCSSAKTFKEIALRMAHTLRLGRVPARTGSRREL